MEWTLVFLYLAYFLVNIVYSLMGPFYPSVATAKGVEPIFIGAVFSMMPAASFVSSPFIGNSMDKFSRKSALSIGILLQAVAMVMLGWSSSFSRTAFIILSLFSRMLSGLSMALVMTACKGYSGFALAASSYPEKLEQIMSLFEMNAGVGMMLGPVVSAQIYDYVGFRWIFFGMCLIFLLYLPCILAITEPEHFEMDQDIEINVFTLVTYKVPLTQEIILDSLAVAYVIICLGIMETYISEHLLSIGLTIEEVGLAFATDPALYTICCFVYSRKLKDMNMKRVIQIGIVLGVLSVLLMGPPHYIPESPACVIAGMTVMGAAIASTFVPALPHMLEASEALGFMVDDRLNDALSSITSGSFSLGEMLGPIVGGVLLHYMDFRNMITCVGISGLLYFLLYLALYRRDFPKYNHEFHHSLTFYKHIHTSLFAH